MSTLVFDTLQYVKKLRDVGISEKQAEAQVKTMVNIIEDQQLATKHDLDKLKHVLERKIHSLELNMHALESRLIRWFLGALLAQGALVVACTKLIH